MLYPELVKELASLAERQKAIDVRGREIRVAQTQLELERAMLDLESTKLAYEHSRVQGLIDKPVDPLLIHSQE